MICEKFYFSFYRTEFYKAYYKRLYKNARCLCKIYCVFSTLYVYIFLLIKEKSRNDLCLIWILEWQWLVIFFFNEGTDWCNNGCPNVMFNVIYLLKNENMWRLLFDIPAFLENARPLESDPNAKSFYANSCHQVLFLLFCLGLAVAQHNQPYHTTTPVPILKQINK